MKNSAPFFVLTMLWPFPSQTLWREDPRAL
jgi:hypothetical protein